jgi:hypothetical protein
MKRKIQHDAVNNQEDEDSSTIAVYQRGLPGPEKRKLGQARQDAINFRPVKIQIPGSQVDQKSSETQWLGPSACRSSDLTLRYR